MAITRAEHRASAEKLLVEIENMLTSAMQRSAVVNSLDVISMAAVAQVHATLSLEHQLPYPSQENRH